jgi:hypothetical protein
VMIFTLFIGISPVWLINNNYAASLAAAGRRDL